MWSLGINEKSYVMNIKRAKLSLEEAILRANRAEADFKYQEDLPAWDITLSDGLSD